MRPVFTLSPRLRSCAEMLRFQCKMVDVGTDHAYLPIWLAKNRRICSALAVDINGGPLEKANSNIAKYQVKDIVNTRISDGLSAVLPCEGDDIVIAGMGGDLICRIIDSATWLKDPEKNLVLQPLSSIDALRIFLYRNGYKIRKEVLTRSDRRLYTTMSCTFCAQGDEISSDILFPYLGKLKREPTSDFLEYISRQLHHLENKMNGLRCDSHNDLEISKISKVIFALTKIQEEYLNDKS